MCLQMLSNAVIGDLPCLSLLSKYPGTSASAYPFILQLPLHSLPVWLNVLSVSSSTNSMEWFTVLWLATFGKLDRFLYAAHWSLQTTDPGATWFCTIGKRVAASRWATTCINPSAGECEVSQIPNTHTSWFARRPRWYCLRNIIITIMVIGLLLSTFVNNDSSIWQTTPGPPSTIGVERKVVEHTHLHTSHPVFLSVSTPWAASLTGPPVYEHKQSHIWLFKEFWMVLVFYMRDNTNRYHHWCHFSSSPSWHYHTCK